MREIDYSFFYKEKFEDCLGLSKDSKYDLFISSFDSTERVQRVYDAIDTEKKHWIILPEYNFTTVEYPGSIENENIFELNNGEDEGSRIISYLKSLDIDSYNSICIDITGFVSGYLIFLVRYLATLNLKKVDFIYSEPSWYKNKEDTKFTDGFLEVRPVIGCEGSHSPVTDNDYLVIASGYDKDRIANVATNKADAKKVQMFGFPSLQPDMFQENVLKAYQVEEATVGDEGGFLNSNRSLFAPANDPFITAQVLREFINKESNLSPITNLYLSPLSTKPQTLGFILYYVYECVDKSVSILLPYCKNHRPEAVGISKIWKYTVEFPS